MVGNPRRDWWEITNLRTILAAGGLVILGGVLLFISVDKGWRADHEHWASLLQEFGSVLVATGVVTVLWELAGKRAFAHELFATIGLADRVRVAGLVNVTDQFYEGVPWAEYFANAREVTLLFAYARTWRNRFHTSLPALASRRGTTLDVILPDRSKDVVVEELALRFRYSRERMLAEIADAEAYYLDLQRRNKGTGGTVRVWRLGYSPTFSAYRFDRIVVLALYHHRGGRQEIPTLVALEHGSMYRFVSEELRAMTDPSSQLAALITEE